MSLDSHLITWHELAQSALKLININDEFRKFSNLFYTPFSAVCHVQVYPQPNVHETCKRIALKPAYRLHTFSIAGASCVNPRE
jgi:hypothetical protein